MLDLKYLTFLKIVETGSFSMAASVLHITQAAASNHIRKLETELGTQLLIRERNNLRLTAAGSRVYNAVKIANGVKNNLEGDLKLNQAHRESLRVGLSTSFASTLVVDAIFQYQQNHPYTQVALEYVDEYELRTHMFNHDLIVLPNRITHPNYITKTARGLPYAVLVPEKHALAQESSVSLRDLKDHRLIWAFLPSDQKLATLFGGIYGIPVEELNIVATTNNPLIVPKLVMQGIGLGICPEGDILLEKDLGLLRAIPIRHAPEAKLYLAYWKDNQRMEAICNEILENLEEAFDQYSRI